MTVIIHDAYPHSSYNLTICFGNQTIIIFFLTEILNIDFQLRQINNILRWWLYAFWNIDCFIKKIS